jgi:hypothetical protein
VGLAWRSAADNRHGDLTLKRGFDARLLNELRQRTTDLTERTAALTEALEQQTATSEVLQVISSSPGDLQPVFATMIENAVRICHAKWGNIHRWEDEALHLVAIHTRTASPHCRISRTPSARPLGPRRLSFQSFYRYGIGTYARGHVLALFSLEFNQMVEGSVCIGLRASCRVCARPAKWRA